MKSEIVQTIAQTPTAASEHQCQIEKRISSVHLRHLKIVLRYGRPPIR